MKSLLLMLPFSNVFYISSNTQSVIDSMKFLYGKYAICCTDEINEFKIKDAIAIQVCFVGRFNMPFLVVYADRQIITDVPIQVITSIIFNQTRFDCEVVPLHAAAVELNGKAYVLIGDTGAGKTTATCYLCKNGFGYITDDCTLINATELTIVPCAIPMHLRQGGLNVLRSYGLLIDKVTEVLYFKEPRYAFMPNENVLPLTTPLAIGGFLKLTRSTINNISKLSEVTEVNMLILKAMRNLSSLDARALRTVVKLTTLVNAFEVKYSDLSILKKMIKSIDACFPEVL